MKTRKLGNSAIEVAPLMLGGNVFGWTADEPTSMNILDAFVAGGRDAGGLCATGQSRQGPRHRMFQLHCGAHRAVAGGKP